jgi:hypothetical protein
VTARWVVDEVRPHREVDITWQPISLFRKNGADPGDERGARYWRTHRLLRVMESVRAGGGDVEALYWEYGRRIHHDRQLEFPVTDALAAVGIDASHAAAFDDASWDDEIAERMDVGVRLAGESIGTPIVGFASRDGDLRAYFGPVITRVPPTEDSVAMFDALTTMIDVQGFWELKRTRTDPPEFPPRP